MPQYSRANARQHPTLRCVAGELSLVMLFLANAMEYGLVPRRQNMRFGIEVSHGS